MSKAIAPYVPPDRRVRALELGPAEHDDKYYLEISIFLVEGTLFRVPRYLLTKESETFDMMFKLPPPLHGLEEGYTDEDPIRLDGISKKDFRALLSVLMPAPSWSKPPEYTIDELMSVLTLATMYDMDGPRAFAIARLDALIPDPVEKLVLAREHHIHAWLVPAFTALIRRPEGPSVEEGMKLGMDWVLKLGEARLRDATTSLRDYYSWRTKERGFARKMDRSVAQTIRGVFGWKEDGTPIPDQEAKRSNDLVLRGRILAQRDAPVVEE